MREDVRSDLVAAHARSLEHTVSPGARLDGPTRRAVAQAATRAYLAADPGPPWAQPYGEPRQDLAHRLARHAATIDQHGYRRAVAEGMDPLEWVEVVGVVVATVPVVAFARAIGAEVPELPPAAGGPPHGRVAPEIEDATLNFVPVAAPADATASVVQALSALPDEADNMWRLAEAQYMSNDAMNDPAWNRGTLSRAQMELVAGRLSLVRECFF